MSSIGGEVADHKVTEKAGPPVVTDDINAGFAVGDIIIDTTASPREGYECTDNSAGAAVWENITTLGEAAPPLAHVSTHENGGSDEMNVGGLNGVLADPQPASLATLIDLDSVGDLVFLKVGPPGATTDSASGWVIGDHIQDTLTGIIYAAEDVSVGAAIWEPITAAASILETSGPTRLVVGTITDGEVLKRVGSTLVSVLSGESTRLPLRNETGGVLAKGTLVAVTGFSGAENLPTVDIADKDDSTKRPSIAVTEASVPNNSNFDGLVVGLLTGLNTSAFSENDQLVLGAAGAVSRPPPDVDPFTGEIQLVGSTIRIDASNGSIYFTLSSGLLPMTAAQFFATKEISPSGLSTGGEVTRAAGLNVDVALGTGFVNDNTDVFRPTWIAVTNLLLPANDTSFVFVDKNGLVQSALSLPDLGTNIILATAITDGASIILLSNHRVLLQERPAKTHRYAREVVGNVTVNGIITTKDAIALRLEVDAGTFYSRDFRVTVPATDPITFTYWFRDGSGGFTKVAGSTLIDKDNFDDGSGTLAALVATEFKKDLLFVIFTATGLVEYHVFYGQEKFTSQAEAEAGNLPAPDADVTDNGIRSGGIVIEGASATIASVVDVRPFIGQLSTGSTAVTDHGLLSGLADDDHSHYQLRSEEDAANGYASLDGSTLLDPAQVPDGADATAIHDNVASEISAITEKATPVNADLVVIEDSADSNNKKRVQIGNFPAPAGVAKIKSGTYTGDGATSQGITGVGFLPKYVKIWRRQTSSGTIVQQNQTTTDIIDDNAAGGAVHFPSDEFRTNTIISLDADGFTVDDNAGNADPNASGVVYNYLAIG